MPFPVFPDFSCFAHPKKPEKFTINNQLVAAQKSQKWVSHASRIFSTCLYAGKPTNRVLSRKKQRKQLPPKQNFLTLSYFKMLLNSFYSLP
jgi:hypothetical protein